MTHYRDAGLVPTANETNSRIDPPPLAAMSPDRALDAERLLFLVKAKATADLVTFTEVDVQRWRREIAWDYALRPTLTAAYLQTLVATYAQFSPVGAANYQVAGVANFILDGVRYPTGATLRLAPLFAAPHVATGALVAL